MADRQLSSISSDVRTDVIGEIARAERQLAGVGPGQDTSGQDFGPDLVEPYRPLAPQGMAGIVDEALGSVRLPTLLELANALDALSGGVEALSEIDPAMSEVVAAVLKDEQAKVLRYLDLRDK